MKIVQRINGKVVAVDFVENYSDLPPEAFCQHCYSEHRFVARMDKIHVIFWCAECSRANVVDTIPSNHMDARDADRLKNWAGKLK